MNERKILLILIAVFTLVIIAVLSTAARSEDCWVLCHPGSRVNVRSKPVKTSDVTAWVECGQYVRTDGKSKNGFIHVSGLASEVPDGWIYTGYLVDEEPFIRKYKAEVYDGKVIARKYVNGKRLRVLPEGKTVTVYAQTHMWAVTSQGYVMCDWLREVEE